MRKSIYIAFAIMTALFAGGLTASAADKVTEGFDTFKAGWNANWTAWEIIMPEGWDFVDDNRAYESDNDTYKTKKPSVCSGSDNSSSYLITPALEGEFSFYIRNYTKSYQASIKAYACTYEGGKLTLGTELGSKTLAKSSATPSWEQVTFTAPTGTGTRVALLISRAYFDDFTYTPYEQAAGASLFVTGQTSGSTFDFGAVRDGATQTFTLNNSGKAELTITSIDVTGGYTITTGADLKTIAAENSADVTISTPAVDATGALTIVSTDANSPYVINLKSTYKAPAPVMVVTPTEVKFGKVTANATRTITVSNTGDAELTASIVSDNEDFTVSKTELTVAASAEETFVITYLYNETAYGTHTAAVTVTPAEGQGETATIAASALVPDPNRWTEDFSSNQLPDGWKAGECWTFSDEVAHAQYVHNANDYLTTPTLLVSSTADQLTFQGRATGIYPDIVIQKSFNGGEWTDYKKIKSDDLSETWTTFTIDGLQAGSYQFRFLSDGYDLDNFEGFRLNMDAPELVVSPSTDADFGKVSTQPEAKTYTLTNSGTGTLAGTITSSDETQFTVSKADFSIAAGESTTFDVALVFNETYGSKAATITIHPTNEGLGDVTIQATATTLDPNVWVEDFDGGEIPENWTNTSWTVDTMTGYDNETPMALAPLSNTASALITPRLLAKKGDVLTWDAYLRWKDEPLLVQYSNDEQATWTTICNYKAEDEGLNDKSHKEMSFTAPEDGKYYLRFSSTFQNGIDNLRGFQLAPSEAVKETWHISYTFHYNSEDGEVTESGVEDMDVEFDGDRVGFYFPNPFTGNAWLRGTKVEQEGIVAYICPMGQYVGQYDGENIYFCGGANDTLADLLFYYDDEQKAFFNFEHVLLNGSTTAISLWAYFSDIIIYKDQMPVVTGIGDVRSKQADVSGSAVYDLLGRRVQNVQNARHASTLGLKKGLYIVNGKKYLIK